MRIVQTSILKLLSLIVLVGSAALVAMWLNEAVYQYVRDYGKPAFHTYYGVGAAGVLFLLAVFGALPLFKERRPKSTISFPGIHGNVTIELDSVEANLGRVVSKMPEVKKIKVKKSAHRGRPKGSKNLKKTARKGRPKGSKNLVKLVKCPCCGEKVNPNRIPIRFSK